jgi:hypothetical protein
MIQYQSISGVMKLPLHARQTHATTAERVIQLERPASSVNASRDTHQPTALLTSVSKANETRCLSLCVHVMQMSAIITRASMAGCASTGSIRTLVTA